MTHAVPVSFASTEWKGIYALSSPGVRIKAVFKQDRLEADFQKKERWHDVQVFTQGIESTFVPWEKLKKREPNRVAEGN